MTTNLPVAAVLFDIDGTLVDSTYVHVAAWLYALQSVDRHVDARRIHRAIGMDGGFHDYANAVAPTANRAASA